MIEIRAFRPDGVVWLSDVSILRLSLAATLWQGTPSFSFVAYYPPSPAYLAIHNQTVSLAPYSYIALLSAPIVVATKESDLQRVVDSALTAKTLEDGIARISESLELFKNLPRVREEVLQACVQYAVEVFRAYREIVQWCASEDRTCRVKAGDQTVILSRRGA